MKDAGFMQKNLFLLILCITAGIFVSSCGLETIISVNEPVSVYNAPLYSSDDYLTWYSEFATNETGQDDAFLGTEIYYKIYNNYSNLNSHRSSILAVNTSSNSSAAATRMIESYGYQTLGKSGNSDGWVFIPKKGDDGENRRVVIRLKNYQDGTGYSSDSDRYNFAACVRIDGTYQSYIPYRNGNSKSFDFFDYDEDNKGGSRDVEPVEGDSDYYYNSTFSEENTYYVQLFAVGVANDSDTVSYSYSLVLDLGSVPIRKGE